MISFPNAKINLGLHIINKRKDGFHNIETVLYPIPLFDILEILPSKKLSIKITGNTIQGKPTENLCFKAYQILREQYKIPPVSIHLHKLIPMGAGLGGGSSDAGFTLKLLNEIFQLQLKSFQLKKMASLLGSDCPFFIDNKPTFASKKGNVFKKVNVDLSNYQLLVIYPSIHSSTRDAYENIQLEQHPISLFEIIKSPIKSWKIKLKNDFENYIFNKFPEIEDIKKELYKKGAIYSSLSGSGSCVYGIFEKSILPVFRFNGNYKIWKFPLTLFCLIFIITFV